MTALPSGTVTLFLIEFSRTLGESAPSAVRDRGFPGAFERLASSQVETSVDLVIDERHFPRTGVFSGPASSPRVSRPGRMHKARHTAGQRLLDATGLKAVQKPLGHESIQTTGDIYTDWDVEQLADSLMATVQDD